MAGKEKYSVHIFHRTPFFHIGEKVRIVLVVCIDEQCAETRAVIADIVIPIHAGADNILVLFQRRCEAAWTAEITVSLLVFQQAFRRGKAMFLVGVQEIAFLLSCCLENFQQ